MIETRIIIAKSFDMKQFLLVVLFSIYSMSAAIAQSNVVRGCVTDAEQRPIVGAVVSCIEMPDSTAVAHCVTALEGAFQINGLDSDFEKYLLEVSFLGYEKSYVKPTADEMTITLTESAITLDNVVVTASAPVLKQKPGKFIYTPSIADAGGIDSYDLLRYAPLMSLDNNSVSIVGKGTSTIYINGRKPVMDNASLMEMLRSTPASQIENIEIIMSPNSSYKASTTGGVVNIVMRKNPNEGMTGSASVSANYRGGQISPRATLYLGYSKNKFNASANLSYHNYNHKNETDVTYNYKDTYTDILNSTIEQTRGHSLGANISASYDFTKRSTLGASLHIGGSDFKSKSTTRSSNFLNGNLDKYSTSVSEIANPFRRPQIGAVAYYNLKTDDKGSNLDISANYSLSLNTSVGNMEYANGSDNSNLVPYLMFQQNSAVDSYGYEFKGRYKHIFDEDSYIEGGYEFNASNISNDFVRNDFDGNEYVHNNAHSNTFVYNEKVNALYITYDRMWNDVISTTFGLRAENTAIKGNQITSNEKFNRNYWNFFPEVSILLDLADGDHSIALDLSRSIVRPFYNDLNPFKIWTSENTYSMGNIYLKPMIYNDVDLSYTLLYEYTIGACYSYGTDAFSDYTYLAGDNTTVSSVANFGNEHTLSLYFNVDKTFFRGIWRMSLNGSADYEVVNGTINGEDIGYTDWFISAGIRNIFRISKQRGIRAILSYNYHTPTRGIWQMGHHKHLLNVSLVKEFKFGGALNIDAMNLLNYKPSNYYVGDNYSYNNNPKTNNITIQLRYTQRFGQNRVRGAQDRSATKHMGRFEGR